LSSVNKKEELISALSIWGNYLNKSGLPLDLVEQACSQNPWFTPYYVEYAFQQLIPWLEYTSLKSFISSYPDLDAVPKVVGMILPGNIPMVGFQDYLIALLSEQETYIQCSGNDKVLIPYLHQQLNHSFPKIAGRIQFVSEIPDVQLFIGTGSNNTLRYFKSRFKNIPMLLRGSRYSIAILSGKESQEELRNLCHDIFLYNGLGCRNISNILIKNEDALIRFAEEMKNFSEFSFSPSYLNKLRYEKAQLSLYPERIDLGNSVGIIQKSTTYIEPGRTGIVFITDENHLNSIILDKINEIQCIVGHGYLNFGYSQHPSIYDFPDGKDTYLFLNGCD